MPDIKVESREHSLPPVATPSSDGTGPTTSPEWDASMELALLNAIASCKPVGMHKHFRIMCVQRKFNETSPSPCSINEIWERLGDYYGMGALDELEEEDKEEKKEEDQQHGDDGYREFSLPSGFDYDQDDDTTRENSPAVERPPSSRRTRTASRREVSPAVTESSVASTPEPEEDEDEAQGNQTLAHLNLVLLGEPPLHQAHIHHLAVGDRAVFRPPPLHLQGIPPQGDKANANESQQMGWQHYSDTDEPAIHSPITLP
ncbi:hypothetical protein [Absidia glauca]|uniref:Chromatin modification-related protein EAF7-domain-containing protein n=1 Tax=Absidia glauca TaxID=4829 RepID=A0A168R4U9_ABSGL|nr:hypothetical protein [Absidia glauca]